MITGRIFAIPDIHGEKKLLDALLAKLLAYEKLDLEKDKLIFLGDMVDRGPDSAGVLRTVRDLTELHPGRVIALAGNHEWIMIDALAAKLTHSWNLWMWNGGGETVKSFGNVAIPDELVLWLASLPLQHEEPGFFFSHAPVPREEDRNTALRGEPFTRHELTWTYDPNEGPTARDFGDRVGVCGHVHALSRGLAEPRFYDHYIFADAGAGCAKYAPLVAIEVHTRKVISVSHRDLEASRDTA